MHLLKFTCTLDDKVKDKSGSYPKEAPYFVNSTVGEKYNGKLVIKTPLWAMQHCLSLNNPSRKRYVIEFSSAEELSMAADGAFIICGFLNPQSAPQNCLVIPRLNTLTIPHIILCHQIVNIIVFQLLFYTSL